MKVTRILTIPVSIPCHKPYVISGGAAPTLDHVLVRMQTDEGVEGIGEGVPIPSYSDETQEDVQITIDKYLAPVVIGQDPSNIEALIARMNEAIKGHSYAKAGIELAAWDAMGKAWGVPVYKLIGGLYREKVACTWCIGLASTESMASEAKEHAMKGFPSIKIKIGKDPATDIEHVAAVRAAIGNRTALRVDANQGYTFDVAVRTLRKMEDYDLEMIEQPISGQDIKNMAKLCDLFDTPVLADESVFTPEAAMKVAREGAADIINIKIVKPGGLYNSKKIAAVAEAAGIPLVVGSNLEMGVGTAASVHFGAATKGVAYPSDLVGSALLVDDIIKEDYAVKDGYLKAPHKPGLGVELNEAKVKKFTVGSIGG